MEKAGPVIITMKFLKDLLFFEVQTTGPDLDKDSVIQLAAVLLDKDNLLEKDNFTSYVRVSYLDSIIHAHAKMMDIDDEALRKSPKVYEAVKKFSQKFSPEALLATHSMDNILFLKGAFKKAAVTFNYDTKHAVLLWSLGYVYLLNYGLKKMPSLHTFLDYFKLKQKKPNDALEKVRLEAEIFRKIIKAV